MTIIYQNKWARIVNKGTVYVVQSKQNKYCDYYFLTANEAYRFIGVTPNEEKYTFITK